jgi:hypothetical protein
VTSTIGKMAFENIADGQAGKITVLDRNGANFDWSKLANWVPPTLQARSGKAESLNDEFSYKLDVRRELGSFFNHRLQLTVKAGGLHTISVQKKWGVGTGYRQTYVGPALASTDYLDTTYAGYDPGLRLPRPAVGQHLPTVSNTTRQTRTCSTRAATRIRSTITTAT